MSRQLNNWLDNYCTYQDHTEVPKLWIKWAGISVLSAALKRRVKIWYHGYEIFPCQYVIFVGPPGLGKGNAIKPAVEIAKEAGVINFLSDRITAEKIIEQLAKGFLNPTVGPAGNVVIQDHTACILAKELPVFLGSSDWMHSLLCQLWDENQFDYSTKHKGTHIIKDLCVSILGGCVPDFIRSLTKDRMAAVTGGFTSRCIFVYENKESQQVPDNWGKPSVNRSLLQGHLINDLQHVAMLSGEFNLSPDAKKLWMNKYKDFKPDSEFNSDVLLNFKSRITSHIIKVAMTLAVAESDSLVIEEHHLLKAIELIDDVKSKIDITFRSVGESPLAVAQSRILAFIEARGRVSKQEILKYNFRHVTEEQLDVIVKILVSADLIIEQWVGSKQFFEQRQQVQINTAGVGIP